MNWKIFIVHYVEKKLNGIKKIKSKQIVSMNSSETRLLLGKSESIIRTLKKQILNLINELNNNVLDESDIDKLIDYCYKLNRHLDNKFFDSIIYDLQLKKNNIYDDFYILQEVDKIKLFVHSYIL